MSAIKKDELERLESKYGLSDDGLSYQHRCSRITAYMNGNGDDWTPPAKQSGGNSVPSPERHVAGSPVSSRLSKDHPLYGKRLLITPMMTIDSKRSLAYDEVLGPEIQVRDFNAGDSIYSKGEEVERMVGDYEIISVNPSKNVIAKTTFPKVGTEISWCLGKELVPVVAGNDRKRGYIWSMPTSIMNFEYEGEVYAVQIYGLKTLIRNTYPELETKFSGKPMMDYADGVTLMASIPMTHALLKKHFREEMMAQKAGFSDGIDW